MRISALLYMYRRRLRSHGLQELLAAVGIAIAVALVFAAIESEASISGSASRVVRTVVGPANLQLRARAGGNMPESVVGRVKRLPGVRQAAPLLEETGTIRTATRSVRVQVAGTDLRLAVLDGLAETLPIGALSSRGVGVSTAAADALSLSAHTAKRARVTLAMRGLSTPMRLTAVLGHEAAGALSGALVAVMPLKRMQQLAGLTGRVSRIFVEARHGMVASVRTELASIAGTGLEVAPARQELRLLRQALKPSGLASGLFAAIGALLGFLLAFNAMLLTVADRRRTIADLRIAGAKRVTIVEMVLFEALCLAVPASIVGLLAGYGLCTSVFHQSTAYLAEAFTLSGATVIQPLAVILATLGGVLATCAASAVPLLDLRRGRARDAAYRGESAPGFALGAASRNRLAATALALVALATALFIALPSSAIAATALLALATVLAVPLAFAAVLKLADAFGERVQRLAILPLALSSLRATTVRSLALAATGAVALFGSVALGGAREDLLHGIHSFASSYVADAPIWVGNPGDNQAVDTFRATGTRHRIESVPGVASVEQFEGGFLQFGPRRVWVIARPPSADAKLLAAEVRGSSASLAERRLHQGGWIVVSEQIAHERHVGVGGSLTLQSPAGPRRFRVAAMSTNLAWPPGVIVMSRSDWSDSFASSAPSAFGVRLAPGSSAERVRAAIVAALGPRSGLEVSLARTRAASIDSLASNGLNQLREVSTMLLIAAIVAMVAATGSSFWQRREGLAGLRLFGARPASLQSVLLLEALLMLLAGCLTGAIAGIYGQVVIDAFLRHVTGFPLASPTTSVRPLEIFVIVLALALAFGAPPSWLAARVPPCLAVANE
jgi:putative ABC transport system permease protein